MATSCASTVAAFSFVAACLLGGAASLPAAQGYYGGGFGVSEETFGGSSSEYFDGPPAYSEPVRRRPPSTNDVSGGDFDRFPARPNAGRPRRPSATEAGGILFPWSTAPPRGRPTVLRPTNTRVTSSSRPGTYTKPGSTRTPPAAGSTRRSQDCARYQQLRQQFAEDTNLSFKIVGGNESEEGEFPYIAALGYQRAGSSQLTFQCAGSLISERYILTAAHCVTDAQKLNLRLVVARLGLLELGSSARVAGDYNVEEAQRHPRHDGNLKYFDLTLLRTDRPVQMSRLVRPVCLPERASDVPRTGTSLLAAGWGATDPLGLGMATWLQKVFLESVDRRECGELLGSNEGLPRGVTDDQLCARDPKGVGDTCSGDSGGPLVQRSATGLDTLVGVTSFGGSPCAGRRPGVYAMTAPALTWIESVVWS